MCHNRADEGSAEGPSAGEPQEKDSGDVSTSVRAGHSVKSLEGFRIDDAIYEALLYPRERAYGAACVLTGPFSLHLLFLDNHLVFTAVCCYRAVLRFEKDIETFVQGREETFLFDTSLSNYQVSSPNR